MKRPNYWERLNADRNKKKLWEYLQSNTEKLVNAVNKEKKMSIVEYMKTTVMKLKEYYGKQMKEKFLCSQFWKTHQVYMEHFRLDGKREVE